MVQGTVDVHVAVDESRLRAIFSYTVNILLFRRPIFLTSTRERYNLHVVFPFIGIPAILVRVHMINHYTRYQALAV